jgi:nucleolar GTP-binding protein
MIFESLPTTPRSEELIDKAFSRAARAGRAKSGREAQESMLRTAANIVSDNLENVVVAWPDFGSDDETILLPRDEREDVVDPFYYELADAVLRRETETFGEDGGVDALRMSLNELSWASKQVDELRSEYQSKMRKADADIARKHRKQAFARIADIVEEIEDDLIRVGAARDALRDLPDVRPDEPAIVVAGYPNVGKSSFVNRVTRASNEIASYPFTTQAVQLGHFEHDRVRYQIIDTPGLLDRPADERNAIERQAVSALTHLADAVLFVVDASGDCGYPVESQLELRDEVERMFDAPEPEPDSGGSGTASRSRAAPVITVCNKADRSRDVEADAYMSVTEGEGVDDVLERSVVAVGYEPDIPPSRRD